MERLQNSQFTFTNKENSLLPHKAVPKTPRQSHNNGNNNNDNKNHKNHKIPVFDDSISTPNKKSTNNNVKRVPLGGKDKNSTRLGLPQKSAGTLHDRGLHLSASAKKRARRLRTPLGKSVNRKLDILRDPEVDNDVVVKKATATTNDVNPFSRPKSSVTIDDDYDEIEHVPAKQPELPYIPLNYTPFTDEDLEVLKRSPSARLEDKRDLLSDVGSSDAELSVNFDFDDYDDDEFDFDKKKPNTGLPHFMEPTFVSNAKRVSKVDVFQDGLTSAELQKLIDEE